MNNCSFRSIEMEVSKEHFQHLFFYFFNNTKIATNSYPKLVKTYGEPSVSIKTCEYWFRQLKSGDFDGKDIYIYRSVQILLEY